MKWTNLKALLKLKYLLLQDYLDAAHDDISIVCRQGRVGKTRCYPISRTSKHNNIYFVVKQHSMLSIRSTAVLEMNIDYH